MFFTKLIVKKLRKSRNQIRLQKQLAAFWGTPKEPSYTFGHPFLDGFIGALFAIGFLMLFIAGA